MTKQTFVISCLLASLSLLCVSRAHGASVGYVASNCDNIVVGTVTSRNQTATAVSFDIAPSAILKGTAGPGSIHVSHLWSRGGIVIGDMPLITQTINGIWCLTASASAGFDVKAINGPDGFFVSLFWPAAATMPAAYQVQNVALADTLLFELAAGAGGRRC